MDNYEVVWIDGHTLEEVQPKFEREVRQLLAEGWKFEGEPNVCISPIINFAHMSQTFSKEVIKN